MELDAEQMQAFLSVVRGASIRKCSDQYLPLQRFGNVYTRWKFVLAVQSLCGVASACPASPLGCTCESLAV